MIVKKQTILKLLPCCFIGCLLRVLTGCFSYHSKLNQIATRENEWYENLAKCESLIIENGDIASYKKFLHTIVNYEGCGMFEIRKQVLPTIIMANKYNYGFACYKAYTQIIGDGLLGWHDKNAKYTDNADAREKLAADCCRIFLERGIQLHDMSSLINYSSFLGNKNYTYSYKDSIYGKRLYELYIKYDNDSVKLWTEVEKIKH